MREEGEMEAEEIREERGTRRRKWSEEKTGKKERERGTAKGREESIKAVVRD